MTITVTEWAAREFTPSKNQQLSLYDKMGAYLNIKKTPAAAFRAPKAVADAFGWLAEFFRLRGASSGTVDGLKKASQGFGHFAKAASLMRAVGLAHATPEKIGELKEGLKRSQWRERVVSVVEFTHHIADLISATLYSTLVFGVPARVGFVADVVGAGSDVCDAIEGGAKFRQACRFERLVPAEDQPRAKLVKWVRVLEIAKAVVALTSGIFAIAAVLTGFALIPAIVSLTAAVAASALVFAARALQDRSGDFELSKKIS